MSERHDGYVVSDASSDVAVAAGQADVLRLQLASAFEMPVSRSEGRLVAFARPALIWDRSVTSAGSNEALHGSVELGLRTTGTSGWQGLAAIRHDGIGNAGFDAWSLRAMMMMRF